MANNPFGWIEIPVGNMERAMKFYEAVFGFKFSRNQMGPLDMAWFPWDLDGKGASGSLVYHKEFYRPSMDGAGVLVYISSPTDDLANELKNVEGAGGKVLVPKTQISPDHGHMAVIMDTEGNRVSLHSLK